MKYEPLVHRWVALAFALLFLMLSLSAGYYEIHDWHLIFSVGSIMAFIEYATDKILHRWNHQLSQVEKLIQELRDLKQKQDESDRTV